MSQILASSTNQWSHAQIVAKSWQVDQCTEIPDMISKLKLAGQ